MLVAVTLIVMEVLEILELLQLVVVLVEDPIQLVVEDLEELWEQQEIHQLELEVVLVIAL
jgi:hypothetical protein